MSRKTSIMVLVAVFIFFGTGAIFSKLPYYHFEEDSMPEWDVIYIDESGEEARTDLSRSGYHWLVKAPASDKMIWDSAGPYNFFYDKFTYTMIQPVEWKVVLESIWLKSPDQVVVKKYPITDWTPDDFNRAHSQGEDISIDLNTLSESWTSDWSKTTIEFDVDYGSIYGIWLHYGAAWVEFSFMVPAADPTEYDFLAYFSGFDDPKAETFTMDPVEWITWNDTGRIEELNLNADDDMPGGFYIYNPTMESNRLHLTDQTKYSIIDPETGNTSKTVGRSEFLNHLNLLPEFGETTLFWVKETGGDVAFIKEQYVP